jgi:type IV secretory pathway VirJ component
MPPPAATFALVLFPFLAVGIPTAHAAAAPAPVTWRAAGDALDVTDLPLRLVPAARTDGTAPPAFVVMLTGDAGWRGLESHVARELAATGLPVVGWNSLRYFWNPRSPDESAADLDRVLRHFGAAFRIDRAIVIGYSQGADMVPFLLNRLPDSTRAHVESVALVAPGAEAFFKFHLSHWWRTPQGGTPVRPEIAALAPLPVLCVYGRADEDALCHDGAFTHVRALPLPGDHGFDRDFRALSAAIVEAARRGG